MNKVDSIAKGSICKQIKGCAADEAASHFVLLKTGVRTRRIFILWICLHYLRHPDSRRCKRISTCSSQSVTQPAAKVAILIPNSPSTWSFAEWLVLSASIFRRVLIPPWKTRQRKTSNLSYGDRSHVARSGLAASGGALRSMF